MRVMFRATIKLVCDGQVSENRSGIINSRMFKCLNESTCWILYGQNILTSFEASEMTTAHTITQPTFKNVLFAECWAKCIFFNTLVKKTKYKSLSSSHNSHGEKYVDKRFWS